MADSSRSGRLGGGTGLSDSLVIVVVVAPSKSKLNAAGW